MMVGLSCHVGEGTVMSGQKKTGVGVGGALSHHRATLSKVLNALRGHRLWASPPVYGAGSNLQTDAGREGRRIQNRARKRAGSLGDIDLSTPLLSRFSSLGCLNCCLSLSGVELSWHRANSPAPLQDRC